MLRAPRSGTTATPAPRDALQPAVVLGIGLAAFAGALALRLLGLDSRDMWLDEIYTQFAASRDWLGLIDDRVSRGHSPFYFAILKLTGIDAADITGLRAVSAVFDAGAAGVLAAGTARYFGLRAALLVALLYALSPLHIHWAQNARPYGVLMLFAAIGLVGTMGLLDTIGRGHDDGDRSVRLPAALFAVGWSGACLTLTGGILAYLVVLSLPWWPGLRRRALAEPAFRRRWNRAQRVPSILAFLTYMLISRVHVIDRIGDYWLESQRPFGWQSLGLLVEEIGAGLPGEAAAALPGLPAGAGFAAVLVYVLAVIAAAIWAAWRADLRPASLGVTALGLGLLAVMLLMSLNTSLLTGRYLSPVWLGLLVSAGIGLAAPGPAPDVASSARARGRRAPVVAGAALVLLIAPFALSTATAPGERRAGAPADIAALLEAAAPRETPIVIDRAIFRDVRMELMLLRLDAPSLPRPDMHGARGGERADEVAQGGGAFFIVVAPRDWEDLYGPRYGAAACTIERHGWVIALVGGGPCTAPFARVPAAN